MDGILGDLRLWLIIFTSDFAAFFIYYRFFDKKKR